ncbi:hypothetical protein GCM10009853_015990 [Glycomyces scopariae]
MSGTGKSTVLQRLAQLGHTTVDTDEGGWIELAPLPDGTGTERMWVEDRIDALLSVHELSGEPLFIAGTVWNQGRFYPRFDDVVLLSAPVAVVLQRIADRDANPYGKSPAERLRVIADLTEFEPVLRETATVEIDTTRSLDDVVATLAALVDPSLDA